MWKSKRNDFVDGYTKIVRLDRFFSRLLAFSSEDSSKRRNDQPGPVLDVRSYEREASGRHDVVAENYGYSKEPESTAERNE